MKISVFICILLCFQNKGSACTFITDSFCKTLGQFPADLILSGVIVAIDATGIDIEVLDILQGEESRDTIRVWDGTDFDCNGTWSLAAADIGNLHDTIIIILPKITWIENDWDVLGDYRRPNPYWQTTELRVTAGIAHGFIVGDESAPAQYNVWSMDYEDMKNVIMEEGDCSSIILAADEPEGGSGFTVNNPFTSNLIVQLNTPMHEAYIRLYSMDGNVVLKEIISSNLEVELNCENVPAGMYLLEVYAQERREIKKIIKLNSR